MTQLLQQAIAEVQKLPEQAQDAIAARIFGELANRRSGNPQSPEMPLTPCIDSRRRIVGTRITIYDILTYSEEGWQPASIALTLGISTSQVKAALDYVATNREEVMEKYRSILARIAKGNPPEIEAKLRDSHARFKARLDEVRRRSGQ